MSDSSLPFAEKKFVEIKGRRMAYIDEGEGAPIVFQHGNPTSSYLWRNVMPACRGLGRLIACDLIGMGDSDKLPNSGPDRYTYAEQRSFLFALWEELKLEKDVVLVLHDWGSVLGFDWANQNRSRVEGVAYMEAIPIPLTWSEFPEIVRDVFRGFRSPAGEDMVLRDNMFVEQLLPGGVIRSLTDVEMANYRKPFLNPGEDRRPTLTWPRQIPLDGEPVEVVKVVTEFGNWLRQSQVPKLWIHGDPGAIETAKVRSFCRTWPNQTEVTVKGVHFLQEDSPTEIGAAVADFVRRLRID
jgi:haloalkane dehalogenase